MIAAPFEHEVPLDLIPWQVGFAVRNIDDAVRVYSASGVGPWSTSSWRTTPYYDAMSGEVIEPVSRIALGRLSDTMAIELIQADPSAGPVPRPWQTGDVGGPTHIAFWSADVEASALRLASLGVPLALAKVTGAFELRRHRVGERWIELPVDLDTSYYVSEGGPMIELVPDRVYQDRLPALVGDALRDIVRRPHRAAT